MRGAIAAGHRLTAEAGARLLAEGGNAVDACIGAAFVSWVVESPLTGPAAGGFLLVHRARDGTNRLHDFFVAVPGSGLPEGERAEMEEVDVDFDGSSTQVFRIGPASCAVPGAVAGLEGAHHEYATLPWRELLTPAVELARNGFELTREQAYLHAILDVILRHTEEGRAVYGPGGERLAAGDRVAMPDLAATLELLGEEGAAALYRGDLGRKVVDFVRERGGALTEEDLGEYRVVEREPIEASFLGHRFLSNPPPSSGGVLIAYGLSLLDRVGLGGPAGTAGATARLVEVMREQSRAREGTFASDLYLAGLADRLCSEKTLAEAAGRLLDPGREAAGEPAEPSRTTHISVVDAAGNAASLTASIGSGSGVLVPGTGIHLNNMLGEYDLNPVGRSMPAGERLTSMMAPSLVLRDGDPRLVVGSAGSIRLRGAILQIVVNAIGHGLPVDEAIQHPRVHAEDGHVHCEGGADPAELDRLDALGYDVVRWRRRNLYFGGAAAVALGEDGSLSAAGDSRRGGYGVVVG